MYLYALMKNMKEEYFWKRVKLILKERGYTQKQTAMACGVPLGTFYGWLAKSILPPVKNSVFLAKFLGVSVEYLVTGKKPDIADHIRKLSAILKKAETDILELRHLWYPSI